MQAKQRRVSFTVPLLVVALLLSVDLTAQQSPQNGSQPSPSGGVMIDPSAGPLKPSETQPAQAPLPNTPQPQTTAPQQSPPPQAQPATQEPLGAAAAENVGVVGGGASRPAGNAIAPVKQHRYRSLVIKLGAAAAVGIAAGTVYALSRATSSTPPHSASASTK